MLVLQELDLKLAHRSVERLCLVYLCRELDPH